MYKHGKALVVGAMIASAATGNVVLAADAAAPAEAPKFSLGDLLTASGITATGYVAASYYHSNGYSTFHQFDVQHDTFQLDQASLTVAYQPKEGFGALVDIAAGEDMKILHYAEDGNSNTFDVVQGFVQYATGPVTIIAGKYVTLAGAEVIAPTGNYNFSRSLLFFAEPLTHTGVRGSYAVNDTFTINVGVNNGWNTTSTSYGSKTGEFGIGYTPSKMFALTAQAYVGKMLPYDGTRTMVDLVGTYNATDALTFVLSYDWGQQKTNGSLTSYAGSPTFKWNGVAAYANWAFADQWRAALRVEYLDDKNNFVTYSGGISPTTNTPRQILKEATVTLGYSPVKSFELRLEGRYDTSTESSFVRSTSTSTSAIPYARNQTGFALQGVYKF